MSSSQIFGTDGIRSTVGAYPLTHDALINISNALAQWIQQAYGNNAQIVIAADTRASAAWLQAMLLSRLLLTPVNVHAAGVLTTPALFQTLRTNTQYDCGIMLSASHNPYHDNGIKIIKKYGAKLSARDEQLLTEFVTQTVALPTYNTFGTLTQHITALHDYIHTVANHFSSTLLSGKTIVLDCAHGAASQIAPTIFEQCGARVITLHAKPNGTNINAQCGALHPQALQYAVREHNADAGFAFDGDADRVIAVNRHGHIKTGDDILALLLQHPHYAHSTHVVGTIMTNQGFQYYLEQQNKKLIRTPVGDKYVAAALEEHDQLLGGESSGHIIMRDYMNTGDGIFTALRVMESIINSGNSDMITFTHFPQCIVNMRVQQKKDLTLEPYASIIKEVEQCITQGRLVIRYSGTEALLRIMVEDPDLTQAEHLGNLLAQKLAAIFI
jgi:phosphoglucosamine mutase